MKTMNENSNPIHLKQDMYNLSHGRLKGIDYKMLNIKTRDIWNPLSNIKFEIKEQIREQLNEIGDT